MNTKKLYFYIWVNAVLTYYTSDNTWNLNLYHNVDFYHSDSTAFIIRKDISPKQAADYIKKYKLQFEKEYSDNGRITFSRHKSKMY